MKTSIWRTVALAGLSSLVVAAPALEAQSGRFGRPADTRVWIDGEPDFFRRGDRMNVRFSLGADAYVAVVHIDTDGNLEFLFPGSPWDVQMLRAGRVHSLPARGTFASTTIRGRPGIGYIYLIASPWPLDFSYFRGRLGGGWDWGYAGPTVRGDPYFALEQITRMIVPRWPYAPYHHDYYSYYVEGIHRYPTYACSDRYTYSYGWGWTPAYGACSRLDLFLRDYPYYYDTRRYRGDRRVYYRDYDRLDPRHGFKESPRGPAAGVGTREGVTDVRSPAFGGGPATEIPRREPAVGPAPRPSAEPPPRAGVPQREAAVGREPAPAPRREPAREPTVTPTRAPEPPQRSPAAEPAAGSARTRPTPDGASPGSGGSTESRAPARGRP